MLEILVALLLNKALQSSSIDNLNIIIVLKVAHATFLRFKEFI